MQKNGGVRMSFTIYARMKKLGKQKSKDLAPVPFVLEKKAGYAWGASDFADGAVCPGVQCEKR